ncbi:hypothetical protein XSR1_260051 [Xenorhabdus szentirmaii DSM 16338]|uniref:Uncharacterized protein n=2 Tax=Xenorhabdus szentirmaii TaxID=290112 RepID=W1IWT3_9GAMM|nr:hypothetical protein Xsze_02073 [Xenorhabdus szentirmaii DSM 16338]CDL82942.1 hypothetical protein XSR1_260051 [Xenorhabdus szentirmaii DSM 16338]
MLWTINSTLVPGYGQYSDMNVFMKGYSFLQLSHINNSDYLTKKQKEEIRDFFFWHFLYTHPVNEETLEAFSFRGQDLFYSDANVKVSDYFRLYHDFYIERYSSYKDKLEVKPQDIEQFKYLTLDLIKVIEGKSKKLKLPDDEELSIILNYVNNIDFFLKSYYSDRESIFRLLKNALLRSDEDSYQNYIFSVFIQNYVCYILNFDFDEMKYLVDYFNEDIDTYNNIIKRIHSDAIFIDRLVYLKKVDVLSYDTFFMALDENRKR